METKFEIGDKVLKNFDRTFRETEQFCKINMTVLHAAVGIELLHNVFVYGTLKRGFFNHEAVLQGRPNHWKLLDVDARLSGSLFVDAYYIPYLFLTRDEDSIEREEVRGELYAVSSQILETLDDLEGVMEGRYTRSRVTVQASDASPPVTCFVYHLTEHKEAMKSKLKRIEQYDITEHKKYYVRKSERQSDRYREEWGVYI